MCFSKDLSGRQADSFVLGFLGVSQDNLLVRCLGGDGVGTFFEVKEDWSGYTVILTPLLLPELILVMLTVEQTKRLRFSRATLVRFRTIYSRVCPGGTALFRSSRRPTTSGCSRAVGIRGGERSCDDCDVHRGVFPTSGY